MLNSLPVQLLMGTVLGFLSGLGVGGGSLLVLWLTVVLDESPAAARTINLLFFLPAAIIAIWFRKKQGILRLRPLIPAIGSGCLFALIFSWISMGLNTDLLKKAFGVLLIITGLRELSFGRKRNDPQSES